jgi:hypothetical protein
VRLPIFASRELAASTDTCRKKRMANKRMRMQVSARPIPPNGCPSDNKEQKEIYDVLRTVDVIYPTGFIVDVREKRYLKSISHFL